MIELEKCLKLLDSGFSLLTVGESKQPNFSWKVNQKSPLSSTEFQKRYNYKGGIFRKDGNELQPTKNIGIITGYNGLEVIDIDLKVIKSARERNQFFDEYINFLRDNIYEFDDKLVVCKTQNAGYHILYRCENPKGNTKIAKLKGQTEAIIESRGVGGYVFCYSNFLNDKNYLDIQTITPDEREIIWTISASYDYKETNEPDYKPSDPVQGLSTWDDYNQRTSIFDIIQNDFEIVRNLNDKYIIRRYGAESPHSGYVYKNTGCMYLFSTATIYPAEKLISPFAAYCYKYHNGDFSRGAKELYSQNYGDRYEVKPLKIDIKLETKDLDFPIDVFPDELAQFILLCEKSLNNSVDYMGCTMLWVYSIIIGNSMKIEVKKGWQENVSLWLALVGKAGIGKTPSINQMIAPLNKMNNQEIKTHQEQYKKYEQYKSLDEKDKRLQPEIKKPRRSQFIANDITLEALIDLHAENKNGVGVYKDELAGWFKDMNKYRKGSDLEHWLSSWSGGGINMNRKTAKSNFVERSHIPVIGGIQAGILDEFYTDENKDNGFIDRILFSYPDLEVPMYSDYELTDDQLEWYSEYVISMYQTFKNFAKYNHHDEIEPHIAHFLSNAEIEWRRIFNEITVMQNSDSENEYLKSMLPKLKSYIPRFSLILNTIYSSFDNREVTEIQKDAVLNAEKLAKYFIAMAKKIKINSVESRSMDVIIKSGNGDVYETFVSLYKSNPDLSKGKIADKLNISRQQVYRYVKKYETENKK